MAKLLSNMYLLRTSCQRHSVHCLYRKTGIYKLKHFQEYFSVQCHTNSKGASGLPCLQKFFHIEHFCKPKYCLNIRVSILPKRSISSGHLRGALSVACWDHDHRRYNYVHHPLLKTCNLLYVRPLKTLIQRSFRSFVGGPLRSSHEDESEDQIDTGEEFFIDKKYRDQFTENYLLPDQGHRVFVIQPDVRTPETRHNLTTPDLQLEEACALVQSLPHWKVSHKAIIRLKTPGSKYLYGKGNFADIRHQIRQNPEITAVFVSVNRLTPAQFSNLQKGWGVSVYDRYMMVLQIFKLRAQTKEAKLQVALAEIPYYRACLQGFHEGTMDQQKGGMQYIGGSGETFMEVRSRLLQERELKLKDALKKLRSQREMIRKGREKHQIPVVAVVGYTNAGKTSLIKALTRDASMHPKDMLFATLDVTAHAGQLENNMRVLYVDTVGFISDIPTNLIESFAATLEDMLNADVIVHVRDESHPDKAAQSRNVVQTLESLRLPSKLRNNIIEVANKIDKLDSPPVLEDGVLQISATSGQGLSELQSKILDKVMENTDRIKKKLLIPMNGKHLSWLYKEATVESAEPAPDNPEALMVSAVMTQSTYSRFKAEFGKSKNSKHNS